MGWANGIHTFYGIMKVANWHEFAFMLLLEKFVSICLTGINTWYIFAGVNQCIAYMAATTPKAEIYARLCLQIRCTPL